MAHGQHLVTRASAAIAEAEAQPSPNPVNARLLEIAKSVEGMISNCDVSSGVCCCGDSMEHHSNPMYCGHSPFDSGKYAASSLLETARTAIAEAQAQPEPAVKPLPGADWTIDMRRRMPIGKCSRRQCRCSAENAKNCIWWDEPGDNPKEAQPARQWAELTDDELIQLRKKSFTSDTAAWSQIVISYARAVIAADRAKNGGAS